MLKRTYKVVVFANENGIYRRMGVINDLGYYDVRSYAAQFNSIGYSCLIMTTKREPII